MSSLHTDKFLKNYYLITLVHIKGIADKDFDTDQTDIQDIKIAIKYFMPRHKLRWSTEK